jgi:hypothetical protein
MEYRLSAGAWKGKKYRGGIFLNDSLYGDTEDEI